MKKVLLIIAILSVGFTSMLAHAGKCTQDDYDRVYNQCLVDRQCGDSALCQSDCVNYANNWWQNNCI